MRTPTRRARVAALLLAAAATAFAAPERGAPAADETIERADFLDWRARRTARALPDGSTLTAYAGETRARGGADASLRVEFVPRFGCAPGVELVVAAPLARRLVPFDHDGRDGDGLVDDDEAGFSVDGTPVGYPVIVDESDGRVRLAFNGNERERVTLRLQLDVGGVVDVELDGSDALRFSLLGSRRTLAAAETLCLTHEPAAPEEDVPPPDGG